MLTIENTLIRRRSVRELKESRASKEHEVMTVCSFCGTEPDNIEKLVAGPKVTICNSCAHLALDVLRERGFTAKA